MITLQLQEIGEVIRKVRKERGLRLEDLADENISPATISNIERGVPHVSTDKAMYLMEKLEIRLESIPELMLREQKEWEELHLSLLGVESDLAAEKTESASELLKRMNLDDHHPHAPAVHYLLGKCYRIRGNIKRAERSFYKAIQLANQQKKNTM